MIHSDQSPHSQANRSSNTIAKRSRPVSSSDASAARVGGRENETQPIPKQNRSDEANQAISPPDHHDGSGSSMSTIDGDMFLRPDKDGEANEDMNRTSSPSPSRLPSSIRAAKLPPFSKKRNRKGGSKKKILKKSPDAPKRFKSRCVFALGTQEHIDHCCVLINSFYDSSSRLPHVRILRCQVSCSTLYTDTRKFETRCQQKRESQNR